MSPARPACFVTILAAALLACGCTGSVREPQFTRSIKVAPGVFAVIADLGPPTIGNRGFNANVGFVVTNAGVVVIDSGPSERVAALLHHEIRRVTEAPLKLVINTNGQPNRWLGNAYFEALGVPILAHHKAIEQMQRDGGTQLDSIGVVLGDALRPISAALPSQSFDTSLVVRIGDTELHLLHFGPAHTLGDSVVWLPEVGVLFSGDIVYVERLPALLPIGSTKHWLTAFDRAMALAPDVLVPGHGAPATITRAIAETRRYLAQIRARAKVMVDAGTTLADGPRRIDQSEFSALANFEALAARNASQAFIEVERESFE